MVPINCINEPRTLISSSPKRSHSSAFPHLHHTLSSSSPSLLDEIMQIQTDIQLSFIGSSSPSTLRKNYKRSRTDSDGNKSNLSLFESGSNKKSSSNFRADPHLWSKIGGNVGVLIVSNSFEVLEVNEYGLDMLECPRDRIADFPFHKMCGPDDYIAVVLTLFTKMFENFRHSNQIIESKVKPFYTLNGEKRYFYGFYRPVYNDLMQPTAIMIFATLVQEEHIPYYLNLSPPSPQIPPMYPCKQEEEEIDPQQQQTATTTSTTTWIPSCAVVTKLEEEEDNNNSNNYNNRNQSLIYNNSFENDYVYDSFDGSFNYSHQNSIELPSPPPSLPLPLPQYQSNNNYNFAPQQTTTTTTTTTTFPSPFSYSTTFIDHSVAFETNMPSTKHDPEQFKPTLLSFKFNPKLEAKNYKFHSALCYVRKAKKHCFYNYEGN